jgi:hypothetical protein
MRVDEVDEGKMGRAAGLCLRDPFERSRCQLCHVRPVAHLSVGHRKLLLKWELQEKTSAPL